MRFIFQSLAELSLRLNPKITLTFFVGCLAAAQCVATPLLRCVVDQGGIARSYEFTPGTDPYSVPAIDINGRFRFKAVVVGNEQAVDYVKLYVYEQRLRQPVMLHQGTYRVPVPQFEPHEAALTGVQVVYASVLERELRYWCALNTGAKP